MDILIKTDRRPVSGIRSMLFLIAAIFLLPGCSSASDTEIPDPEPPGPEPLETGTLLPDNITLVARVTGRSESGETIPNPNRTDARFNIGRTDYSNMWDAGNGTVMCAFGDNFDYGGGNWKSNAIALSSDRDLTDGLYYSGMLMDGNAVKEIVVSRAKTGQYPDGSEYEVTCIPTGGIAVGTRQYLNYMSIHDWTPTGDNDYWSVNYSEIVYSDNYGTAWTRSGVKWNADSNFTQVAYLKENGLIYMYGTHSGRYGNVYLARVSETKLLDKSAYEYWTGGGWERNEQAAEPVARGTASEMTVAYNSRYKRYMMMYLSVNQRAVVYRDAPSPEGDWSGEKIIMYEDGNALYAPYIPVVQRRRRIVVCHLSCRAYMERFPDACRPQLGSGGDQSACRRRFRGAPDSGVELQDDVACECGGPHFARCAQRQDRLPFLEYEFRPVAGRMHSDGILAAECRLLDRVLGEIRRGAS